MSILLGGVVRKIVDFSNSCMIFLTPKKLRFYPKIGAVVNSSPGIYSEVWKNHRFFLTTGDKVSIKCLHFWGSSKKKSNAKKKRGKKRSAFRSFFPHQRQLFIYLI